MDYSEKIKGLNRTILDRISKLFFEIDEKFQLSEEPTVRIPFRPANFPVYRKGITKPEIDNIHHQYITPRLEVLKYLEKIGIIQRYNVDAFDTDQTKDKDWHIEICLNIQNYKDFKSCLENLGKESVIKNSFQENFNIIIEAIIEAKEENPDNPFTVLNFSRNEKLSGIPIDDIKTAFETLQNKEKILTVNSESYPKAKNKNLYDYIMENSAYFELELSKEFDNWYIHYKTNQEPEVAVVKPAKIDKPALKLPPNTKWKDITIKFKDGHKIDIIIADKTTRSDYEKMGFEDRRTRKPDKQWALLIKLSENNGEIDWHSRLQSKTVNTQLTKQKLGFEDNEDTEDQNRGFSYKKASDSIKKTKQLLAKKLKTFFGIKEDPFFPYRKEGSYKIKIILITA